MTIETGAGLSATIRDRLRRETGTACRGTLHRIFAAAAGRADVLPVSVVSADDAAVQVSPAVWPSSSVGVPLH